MYLDNNMLVDTGLFISRLIVKFVCNLNVFERRCFIWLIAGVAQDALAVVVVAVVVLIAVESAFSTKFLFTK